MAGRSGWVQWCRRGASDHHFPGTAGSIPPRHTTDRTPPHPASPRTVKRTATSASVCAARASPLPLPLPLLPLVLQVREPDGEGPQPAQRRAVRPRRVGWRTRMQRIGPFLLCVMLIAFPLVGGSSHQSCASAHSMGWAAPITPSPAFAECVNSDDRPVRNVTRIAARLRRAWQCESPPRPRPGTLDPASGTKAAV